MPRLTESHPEPECCNRIVLTCYSTAKSLKVQIHNGLQPKETSKQEYSTPSCNFEEESIGDVIHRIKVMMRTIAIHSDRCKKKDIPLPFKRKHQVQASGANTQLQMSTELSHFF